MLKANKFEAFILVLSVLAAAMMVWALAIASNVVAWVLSMVIIVIVAVNGFLLLIALIRALGSKNKGAFVLIMASLLLLAPVLYKIING